MSYTALKDGSTRKGGITSAECTHESCQGSRFVGVMSFLSQLVDKKRRVCTGREDKERMQLWRMRLDESVRRVDPER